MAHQTSGVKKDTDIIKQACRIAELEQNLQELRDREDALVMLIASEGFSFLSSQLDEGELRDFVISYLATPSDERALVHAELAKCVPASGDSQKPQLSSVQKASGRLTSWRMALQLGMKTSDMLDRATTMGYLEVDDQGQHRLTRAGSKAGVKYVSMSQFGAYFLWPVRIDLGRGAVEN